MRWYLVTSLICFYAQVWGAPSNFTIQYFDRKVKVVAPDKAPKQYSVIVENKSLSDLYAKFMSHGKDLKFFTVKPSQFKTIEFSMDNSQKVYFVPLNPPTQEVLIEFGKASYEVPPTK